MEAKATKPKDLPNNPLPWRMEEAYCKLENVRYADIIDGNGVYVAQYLNTDSAKMVCDAVNSHHKLVGATQYFIDLVMKHSKLLEECMTDPGCAQMYSAVAEARATLQRN